MVKETKQECQKRSMELWESCETARAGAKAEGADIKDAHAASVRKWNQWVKTCHADQDALKTAGDREVARTPGGNLEPRNDATRIWFENAAIDFSGHTFDTNADFRYMTFPGDADFAGAKFNSFAIFGSAIFAGNAIGAAHSIMSTRKS